MFRICLVVLPLVILTGGSVSAKVQSLHEFKQELYTYHDSGRYEHNIKRVITKAMKHLKSHRNTQGKLVLVLDIDETSLSNWTEMRQTTFCFNRDVWNKWGRSAKAPAIRPTLELFNQAKHQGVDVFFITGRTENLRAMTVKNLKKAGYSGWAGLILKKNKVKYPSAEFYKTAARKKITDKGYRIILSVGDQESDLIGGYAEKTFKLPNPFYYIP